MSCEVILDLEEDGRTSQIHPGHLVLQSRTSFSEVLSIS